MKRTNRFLTAAALLILAAVAAYTVAYIWRSAHIVRTATAVADTVQRVGHAEGILVRDEMVIDGGDDVTVIVAEDGERVAAGSTLAFSGTRITAACSGIFLSQLDGYEHLTPSTLKQLTPSRLELLKGSHSSVDENSPGKLVCSSRWYYAAVLPKADAALLSEGDTLTLDFSDTLSIAATVDQVSQAEDGSCALVFSSTEQPLPVLQLRCTTADILLAEYEGFSVPQEAVLIDAQGQAGLYAVVGGIAEFVEVEILDTETKEDTLFVAPLNPDTLYDGSTVLTQCDDVYDGMVLS